MRPLLAQNNANGPDDEVLILLAVFGAIVLVWQVIKIPFLLTLHKALARCQPHNRTMEPGMVWLNMIPLFDLVWQFITVNRIGDSLYNEFRDRGWHRGEDYGRGLGLAACILYTIGSLCTALMAIAGLICGILYWTKIAGYSKQLASRPYEDYGDYDEYEDYEDYDDRNERDDRHEDRPWNRGRR
jgi:hypothetical protein